MRDLSRLLRPRSIAVIGGGAIVRYVTENCRKLGFDGDLWHVHPTKGPFAAVKDLPYAPDACFIGVNRLATLDILADLSAMGAGGAVAYASGFAEAAAELDDSVELQARLIRVAGEMPVIGPNCYGFLNYLDGAGLWPDQQGGRAEQRGVAIITQSSNIAINLTMQKRGVPLAYVVTAGNQAQIGLAEIGAALISDPRVTALGMHIEGIGDLRAFEGLARVAARAGTPIVALKVGRSGQAQAAAVSHTASLAGSAAGSTALFQRLGLAEVASLPELLETLKLLHVTGPLRSAKIASMSCSGGEASLMADGARDRNLSYPALSAQQTDALRATLGPKVALANPLDYHTYIWADGDKMGNTFAAMMTGAADTGVIVADFPRDDRCSDADWDPVIQGAEFAAQSSGKNIAIASTLPESMPEKVSRRLIDKGIAPLSGLNEALVALEAAAFLGRAKPDQNDLWVPVDCPSPDLVPEAAAKTMFAAYGLDIPKHTQAASRQNVGGLADKIGYPVALKGTGVAHKTEAGVVALNINTRSEAIDIASNMPGESFLIEEMITDAVAELLIGVTIDRAHGYLLTIAAGGTLTELLQDQAHLLLPTTDDEIRCAIGSLRIAKLLSGYRGASPANIDAVVAAINALQSFVGAHQGKITEVEINPLICTQTRAVAADALLRIGDEDVG